MADRWQGGGGGYEPHRPPVNPRPHAMSGRQGQPLPPRGRSDGPPPAPPRRRKRRVGRIIGIIVLVIIVLLAALWFYVDFSLQRVGALADYSGRPAQGAGTNWLVVGSDSRQGLTDAQAAQLHTGDASAVSGGRTDSILLVHLPANSTKPTMVSLLRDSQVSIPGHGKTKINAAFAYGGAPLLVQTVEEATGLRIDHYAEIGLGGFASVVDDVGGVTMCLPQADNDPDAGVNLPAGCQKLNGANALGYVRSRHAFASSDFARTEHQREFIGALADRIASPGVLLNPFDFVPVLTDLPKALTVDEGDHLQNLVGLAWDMRGISSGGVVTTAVPISGSSGGNLLWDPTKSQELFHDLNNDDAVPSSLITNN
ncbi:MAG TPA: LCP family protein [Pseudonocardiaceae bacterium]|jgi:LCP family protein required for cell wall assembly|nr:LCP family protein [Pseudonocardiaceae bacterium]